VLYIVSEPYVGNDGAEYPAYNAWGAPYPHPTTGAAGRLWDDIKRAIVNMISSAGKAPIVVGGVRPHPAVRALNVIAYAVRSAGDQPASAVAGDAVTYTRGGETRTCVQWYSTEIIQDVTCPVFSNP
jgi:hypothetical protein